MSDEDTPARRLLNSPLAERLLMILLAGGLGTGGTTWFASGTVSDAERARVTAEARADKAIERAHRENANVEAHYDELQERHAIQYEHLIECQQAHRVRSVDTEFTLPDGVELPGEPEEPER